MLLALALSLAAVSDHGIVHTASVDHGGTRYGVDYRPHLSVQTKTVGAAAGTRPSTQQCRWTMNVAVERSIRNPEGRAISAALLPQTRTISGSRHGDCITARAAIGNEQRLAMREVREHVARVASADRNEALAALDAAGQPRA